MLIASGATIEGGAVLDAVFILVLKLGPNEAIPLASVTVFGGVGTVFGASITSWFSTWLFLVALIVYLAYIGKNVLKKARTVGHEEGWRCCSRSGSMSLLGAPSLHSQYPYPLA
uniref:Uncharacterized protein n=1 Tax=Hyaloperonospora arabidopsidis (strain Emoy2) TaxID=559515 RepID=M4BFN8_HYAAE